MYCLVHCVKSVRIWSFSAPYFRAFGLNKKKMRSISPYSVPVRGNTGQENSEYGHFLRSDCFNIFNKYPKQASNEKNFISLHFLTLVHFFYAVSKSIFHLPVISEKHLTEMQEKFVIRSQKSVHVTKNH